jgi:hypothetical protein
MVTPVSHEAINVHVAQRVEPFHDIVPDVNGRGDPLGTGIDSIEIKPVRADEASRPHRAPNAKTVTPSGKCEPAALGKGVGAPARGRGE